MLTPLLAMIGAIVYGSADFLGGLASKRLRSIVVTSISASSGLAFAALASLFITGTWSIEDSLWGVATGFAGVLSLVLLYACLAIGPMSILSPLTAVVSAIAPIAWGLLVAGETLATIGYAGLAVALVAVVMVGFIPGEKVVRPTTQGLLMAVGAGVAIGAFLILMDQTSTASGLTPLLVNRATNIAVCVVVIAVLMIRAARSGRSTRSALEVPGAGMPRARAVRLAIACGVADAAANTILLIALRLGDLAIVSALTALYPAGTILLAAVILRERIAAVQWLGLALALTAAGMLAVA